MGRISPLSVSIKHSGNRILEVRDADIVGASVDSFPADQTAQTRLSGGVTNSLVSGSLSQLRLRSRQWGWPTARRVWLLVLAGVSGLCLVALSDVHSRNSFNFISTQDSQPRNPTSEPTPGINLQPTAPIITVAPAIPAQSTIQSNTATQPATTTQPAQPTAATQPGQVTPYTQSGDWWERVLREHGMSTLIVLFFGYLFYQSWKQLLPLYVEKRKQEIIVLQTTTETLGTVATTQTAATNVLHKIGEQVVANNATLGQLNQKVDDCIEEHEAEQTRRRK